MHRVLQIEMRGQRCQIIGVVVHVVTVPGLAGAAVATSIVRDYTETVA